ncbi:ATPase [Sulfurifustis variabilis]|uniref:ATPase n=1 Tax=Sulfurifustis variabilis TaxID=1675686 RepID=A0A1B4V5C1_9GAMM|nr:V-type ATP synthase subunit F [Sulfurifustis variabilis]BAU48720.1 ATPase [Sulfurifustis variabilis]
MADAAPPPATRLLALGSSALMEGFSLIGAETYPEATGDTVERVLGDLLKRQEKALVFLEHHLARDPGPWLRRVREEGGRIVVAEIPPLHAPEAYRPGVEDVVRAILGPQALEPRT